MPSSIHPLAAARRATLLAATATVAFAAAANAQSVNPGLPTVPLNDTDCNFEVAPVQTTVPPCTVDGTRTVTYNGRTRTVRTATTDYLIDNYSVSFSGNLKVDGAPVINGSPYFYPFGNTTGVGGGPVEASYFFGSTGQTVNVTSNYTGERVQIVTTGGAGNPVSTSDPAYWSRLSNLNTTINSIAINLDSYFETTDGGSYDFTLASINASNIVNNGTALAGKFNGTGGANGAIQFGTLAGTATLQSGGSGGYAYTPYPADTGAQNTGMISLYQLGYAVTATVTTSLDETGLVTPKVAVTQGIEMNGSKVTGLAAGTSATDAVNKAQLDAAIAGVGGGGGSAYLKVNSAGAAPTVTGDGAIGLGGNVSASGQNALAIGSQSIVTSEGGVAIGGDSGADPDTTGARAELYATSIGTDSNAGGTAASAVGAFAKATDSYASAIGFNAVAGGTSSTAIGTGAYANRTQSTAIGAGATSTHTNSTAVGAGARTTADNQLVLGSSTTAVKVAGIDASTAAQQGPVDVVTIDANGTLGRQKAATAQSVQEVRVAMDMIAAVTDSQFDALSGTVQQLGARVADLEFRLDDLNRSTSGGIAAAMAMGGTMVVPDSTISLSVNASTYRGEQGYSGSVVAKVGEKVYVSGAIGGSSVAKSRGGRVGMAVGF